MKPGLYLLFFTCFLFAKSYSQVNLNAGLVAYYPFNGNANDASGNGLNGTPTNGAQLTTDKFGTANSAYQFDGVDDVILVKDNGQLSLPTFTLAYYFMTTSTAHQICLGKINYIDGNGATYNSGLNVNGASNTWFNLSTTNSPCFQQIPGTLFFPSIANTPVSLNEWHCIVNTFENGNEKIYMDGQLVSAETLPFTAGKYCTNTDFLIGSWWSGDLRPFKGKLDEVRVYNRIINTDEIAALCSMPPLSNCDTWLSTPSLPSYVDVGDLDVAGNQLTVEATINRTQPYAPGTGDNNDGDIVSKHTNPTNINYLLRPNHAYITTTNGFFATPDVCEIELNKTYHLAMVYDGTSLKYYRNGFLMCQVAATGNLFQNDFPARIGLYSGAVLENFEGYTNEVRIWNVARTQQQIRDNMTTSLPNPATQTGLLAYYTFDNLLNKQGNPLWNGTLNGAAAINQTNPTCSAFVADSCAAIPCAISEDFIFKQDVCNPLSITFQSSAVIGNYDEIKWNFGDGNTAAATDNPSTTYLSQGSYDVEMIVVKGACSDTVRKSITVGVIVGNVILTSDTTICPNSSLKIQTKPALNFCWSPVTYLDNPNSPNPTASPLQNIKYYYTAEIAGTNLITNGDFSAGNSGFTSGYVYANLNVTEGQYFVGTSPQSWNASLSNCGDHTTGNGRMLLVNGAPVADVNVWKQTIAVTPNTNYAFSTWIQALWPPNPAQLQFSINGKAVGTTITATLPTCTWTQFYTTWNSGNNSSAVISIVNKNIQVQGNDFALDDISFAPVTIMKDSIAVNLDHPTVTASNDTTMCNGSSVQLHASGGSTYAWSPGAGLSNPSAANPIATPTATTQYIVTGTSASGCTANDTVNISINNSPSINKTADTSICKNSSIQLNVSGGSAYAWIPSTTLNNPAIPNPTVSPVNVTTYYVNVTGANGCSKKDSIRVDIYPDPVFTILPGKNICENNPVQLGASGGNSYSWQPATSLSNGTIADPEASPLSTTTYSVLIRDTVCGASANLSTTITVFPSPVVRAAKSNDIDCSTGTSQLSATGASGYRWTPAMALSNAGISNPIASPQVPTMYSVTGTSIDGCSSSDSILVDIKAINKSMFLMPNAFSPNNDGKNDCYRAKNWGYVTEFELSIFNRWGERVFYTKNPGQCWDGTYKGVPQKSDVYVYIVKAKSLCQSSVFRKGTVALIR
jgi:gliding motility-associated-like protein